MLKNSFLCSGIDFGPIFIFYFIQGFLVDGYPSDAQQASTFIDVIGKPNIVICLEVTDEVMEARLKSRGNFDDQPEAVQKRIKSWNEVTKPVADANNAFVINAERPANEIHADVEKALS